MLNTNNNSPVPKKSGDEIPQQSSPVSTNQDRVKKELPKSLTLYIPENLDFDSLLSKNPPNFKFHKDKFIYIVNLLTEIPSRNKDKDYIYVPIYSSYLKTKVYNYGSMLNIVGNQI